MISNNYVNFISNDGPGMMMTIAPTDSTYYKIPFEATSAVVSGTVKNLLLLGVG